MSHFGRLKTNEVVRRNSVANFRNALKTELDIETGLSEDILKDRYYAAVSNLLSYQWTNTLEKAKNLHPRIKFPSDDFHSSFLDTYLQFLDRMESAYSRVLYEKIRTKIKSGPFSMNVLSDEERSFFQCMAYDYDQKVELKFQVVTYYI